MKTYTKEPFRVRFVKVTTLVVTLLSFLVEISNAPIAVSDRVFHFILGALAVVSFMIVLKFCIKMARRKMDDQDKLQEKLSSAVVVRGKSYRKVKQVNEAAENNSPHYFPRATLSVLSHHVPDYRLRALLMEQRKRAAKGYTTYSFPYVKQTKTVSKPGDESIDVGEQILPSWLRDGDMMSHGIEASKYVIKGTKYLT